MLKIAFYQKAFMKARPLHNVLTRLYLVLETFVNLKNILEGNKSSSFVNSVLTIKFSYFQEEKNFHFISKHAEENKLSVR